MPDREKVIRGLQCIIDGTVRCESCGYAIDKHGHYSCQQNCVSEAITLLKEHESVERKVSEWMEDSDPGQEYGTTWGCRKCMHSIHKPYIWNPYDSGYKYCPHCGAMMER